MMITFNKEMMVEHKYLNLPIRNGSKKIVMRILCEGKVVREFDAQLDLGDKREWWAYYDIAEFKGQNITLAILDEQVTESQISLLDKLVTQSDDLLYTQDLYQERYRPQLHFTPKRGWNNDPNGLVYAYGVWHLFFQHNPFGVDWGSMHWGHAVSPDLVHWLEQPIALYPRSIQDMAFSGGGFLGPNDILGIKAEENRPIILSFTSTGRGECIAYSLDQGKTFQEIQDNPVLVHEGRDPKIVWYENLQKWIMIVYEEGNGQRGYDLYTSSDLIDWRKLQHLPEWYECPEFFTLPVENDDSEYWVVYGSVFEKMRSAFLLGQFDGGEFSTNQTPQIGHAGPHFYAAQIFSNAPMDRKIMLGWLAGADYPGMPFSQGMTVPLELSLRKAEKQTRLCFYPVVELDNLRQETFFEENLSQNEANTLLQGISAELLDLEFDFDVGTSSDFEILVGEYPISYDPELEQVKFCGSSVFRQPQKRNLQIRILVDRSVTEVFVDQGWGAFASKTLFLEKGREIHIKGDVPIKSIKAHTLKSMWIRGDE